MLLVCAWVAWRLLCVSALRVLGGVVLQHRYWIPSRDYLFAQVNSLCSQSVFSVQARIELICVVVCARLLDVRRKSSCLSPNHSVFNSGDFCDKLR